MAMAKVSGMDTNATDGMPQWQWWSSSFLSISIWKSWSMVVASRSLGLHGLVGLHGLHGLHGLLGLLVVWKWLGGLLLGGFGHI